MKPPAFQFYADDFLAGTADMTQPEVGAYILLLCHQWGRGAIPSDPARAALIAKGEVPAHVMAKFPNGKNERLERVREVSAKASTAESMCFPTRGQARDSWIVRVNAKTANDAKNHGQEWTAQETAHAMDYSRSAREVSADLGRSLFAVIQKRKTLNRSLKP
jgi:uncharacterized protein YdaU (DUF1376 family)